MPAALMPGEAKALAERKMIEVSARAATATIRLPYRALALRPGDILRHPADGALWRVDEMTVERLVVELALERVMQLPLETSSDADGGCPAAQNGAPNGETVLHALDLPPLYDDLPASPRIWLATSGREQGWRRADLSLSLDAGASWQGIYTASGGGVAGVSLSSLGPAGSTLWDDHNIVDVELAHDGMWIEGRSDDTVLAGGNLALIDDELIQFGRVEALGARRFRLSRLLRGRRGTEWAVSDHPPGGRFVMIDPALTGVFDLPASRLGSPVLFRASGPGEDAAGVEPVPLLVKGNALLPPSPVHLQALLQPDGGVKISWIRRGRQGWGWVDGVDVPLGEEREAYRLTLQQQDGTARSVEVEQTHFTYSAEDRTADGGDIARLSVAVRQLSALAGPGIGATSDFLLPG